jgi:hypothetical protein
MRLPVVRRVEDLSRAHRLIASLLLDGESARTTRHSWLGIEMRLSPLAERARLDFWYVRWSHWAAGTNKKRGLHMNATRDQRLEHFNSAIYGHVEGWLGDQMSQIVSVIGTTWTQMVCEGVSRNSEYIMDVGR